MKKKKKFNFLINIGIILIVLSIVLYFSLKDHYEEVVDAILHMNYWFFILAILVFCLYRIVVSLAHYLVIRENSKKVSLLRCIQINFIILFFHGITPFAGGGQPMEIYYLHNEGISVTKATNITLQNFIIYQIALVIMGIFAFFYNAFVEIFPNDHLIKRLVVLGFFINFFVLMITFLLSFGKKLNEFVCNKGIHLLTSLKIIKDPLNFEEKAKKYLNSFHQNALQLKKSWKFLIGTILIHLLGFLLLYSLPFIIARGMGISISMINSIVATAYVMIIGSFVPIPGGTGGIEYGFMFFFGYLIQGHLLSALMLVWRFISYYLGMIFGSLALMGYRKKAKSCE